MSIDTDAIRAQFPIKQLLEERYGRKFKFGKCLCPLHDDQSPSLSVKKASDGYDRFTCHAASCGKRGDVIQLVMELEGCTMPEAVEKLTGQKPVTGKPPANYKQPHTAVPLVRTWEPVPARKVPTWTTGTSITALKSDGKPLTKKAELVHRYLDRSGKLLAITTRIRLDGGKAVLPLRYMEGDWHWRGFGEGELTPIYGAHMLERFPNLPVLLVEGEKCVDIVQPLVEGKLVVVTWMGGTGSIEKADWQQLWDRKVILFPDFDHLKRNSAGEIVEDVRGGQKAMLRIAELLKEKNAGKLSLVDISHYEEHAYKSGYDIVDMLEAGMPIAQVLEFIKARARPLHPKEQDRDWDGAWLPEGVRLVMTSGDKPGVKRDDPTNLWLLLNHHPRYKGRFSYDVFDQLVLIDDRPMDGASLRDLRFEITQRPGWTPKLPDLKDSVTAIALCNRTNLFARQLLGLVWDGKRRLAPDSMVLEEGSKGLLVDYANCEDKPFNRITGMRWLIGCVQRVLQDPYSQTGWQHDSILVLEGEQGFRKTSFLRVLGSVCGREAYTELQGSLGRDKDDLMKLRGKAIVELAEMTAHRKSDQDAFKAFIDKKVDEYRPPYGEHMIKQPRMVVFAGTTNQDTYLNDPTGARRFWPARVLSVIDTHKLKTDLEQIWAEAVHLAQAGEPNFLQGEEVEWHETAVDSREQIEAWADFFETNRQKPDYANLEGYTTQQAFAMVGIFDPKDMTPGATRRLEDLLRSKGFRRTDGNKTTATRRVLWRLTRSYSRKQKLSPRG